MEDGEETSFRKESCLLDFLFKDSIFRLQLVRFFFLNNFFFGGFLLEGEIFGLRIKAPTFRIRKDYDYHMTHPVKLTSSYHGYLELVLNFRAKSNSWLKNFSKSTGKTKHYPLVN